MVVFCTESECTTRASFGFPSNEKLKCATHKLEGMECLTICKCLEPGCNTSRRFNFPHLKSALYCSKHKKEGMICVTLARCKYEGCLITPSFNKPGEKRGLYCDTHKLEDMINVTMPRCMDASCNIYPTYGVVGTTRPLYCVSHKKEDMLVVIKTKTCQATDCKTRASYGEELGEKTHCAKHRTLTMLSLTGTLCAFCTTRASYNYVGEKMGIYCQMHKLHGMVNVKDAKCIEHGCMILPSFNYSGLKKGIYCRLHKKSSMINVREKTCKTLYCTTQVGNNKYDGFCLNCFMHLFPDKPVARNYKTKEKAVREYLVSSFSDLAWTFDVRLAGGKSLRRPDAVLDLSSHAIIVEVDENQHASYECTCENKRLMELSLDMDHKPLTFIRFNPDGFINAEGVSSKPCWKIDGNGILRVHKEEISAWTSRLSALREIIDYWIEYPTDKTVNVVQLFFDAH